MEDWKLLLAKIANRSETIFDRFKLDFARRMGWTAPIQVLTYLTYGNHDKLNVMGRVLHDKGIEVHDRDTIWVNIVNMYKRFNSSEIAGAKLNIRLDKTSITVITDEEGYFQTELNFSTSLPKEELWHHPIIDLLESPVQFKTPIQARSKVMTPPSTARFGIISDIDDTIIPTHAQSLLKSAFTTFLNNAHTRLPYEGVAAFYKALQDGISGAENNPVFYVSSSPWNLYDLLYDFITVNRIPQGPLLLKDYGFAHNKVFSESHIVHKTKSIAKILDTYPTMPFILIGDSGQLDPEIYAMIIQSYPERILAVYIRDVSKDVRDKEIKHIYVDLNEKKIDLILSENSYTAALHAAEKEFINPSSLQWIKEEKELDHVGEDLY